VDVLGFMPHVWRTLWTRLPVEQEGPSSWLRVSRAGCRSPARTSPRSTAPAQLTEVTPRRPVHIFSRCRRVVRSGRRGKANATQEEVARLAKSTLLTSPSPTSRSPRRITVPPLISATSPALELAIVERHALAAAGEDEHAPGNQLVPTWPAESAHQDPAMMLAAQRARVARRSRWPGRAFRRCTASPCHAKRCGEAGQTSRCLSVGALRDGMGGPVDRRMPFVLGRLRRRPRRPAGRARRGKPPRLAVFEQVLEVPVAIWSAFVRLPAYKR
jgi:hypothetical protein